MRKNNKKTAEGRKNIAKDFLLYIIKILNNKIFGKFLISIVFKKFQ